MILQYKGFNNNITYEDSEQITVSVLEISRLTKNGNNTEEELNITNEISRKIEEEIIQKTNCANITYITDKPICECGIVKVVMLEDKNKHRTYVFDTEKEVYLLNDSGKTIRKV